MSSTEWGEINTRLRVYNFGHASAHMITRTRLAEQRGEMTPSNDHGGSNKISLLIMAVYVYILLQYYLYTTH